MTMFEVDGLGSAERAGSGVRVSAEVVHSYDLTVIAADVDGVVASAGGWLCDRVRAGWQVTVLVAAGADTGALTVLGVRDEALDSAAAALRRPTAAVAVDTRVLTHDENARTEVLRLLDSGRTEVTVWGTPSPVTSELLSDARFDTVCHRASAAARAFKAGALRTCGHDATGPSVETFISAGLWYPPDGGDLVPVSGT